MAQAEKEQSVDRIDLLFDEERLSALHQQYNTASGIKANVSTSAATYEIRSTGMTLIRPTITVSVAV